MATYLVTGGAGFIGSHLCEALIQQGHAVNVLDDFSTGSWSNLPEQAKVWMGDVADASDVMQAMRGVDGVFHLAAVASVQRSNEAWLETHRANLTGTIQVFEAARRLGDSAPLPVVYASSAAVYGHAKIVPTPETAALQPMTAYGADKLGCELHAKVGGLIHAIPSMGFRFFNVYGPRQDPKSPYSGVISIFADRVAQDLPVTVNGTGEQVRDFIYVGDIARHLIAGLDRASVEAPVLNACTGKPTSVNTLLETIARVRGRTPRRLAGAARPGDIRLSLGNPARAQETLGISAETSLAQGLEALFNDVPNATADSNRRRAALAA